MRLPLPALYRSRRRPMKRLALLAPLALGFLPLALHADGRQGEPTLYPPQAIEGKSGPASLPSGAEIAVLEGDPTKEGPFTMRIKLPDGYRIPPHTHPKTERLTVISGAFRLGMGDRFDERALRTLHAGTYGYWPAG